MPAPRQTEASRFQTFATFYPFYLSEHADQTCRRLHFVGTSLSVLCLLALVVTGRPIFLLIGLVVGYGFAWVGHFAFEKNRPASFKQPFYSFMSDWTLWFQILSGRIKF
jgi:hypothetical protein